MCLQDKAPSKPDLVLVGHEDIAPFALGTCQPEPLVASGGKDTHVSPTTGLSQHVRFGLAVQAVLHAVRLLQLGCGARSQCEQRACHRQHLPWVLLGCHEVVIWSFSARCGPAGSCLVGAEWLAGEASVEGCQASHPARLQKPTCCLVGTLTLLPL